MDVYEALYTTRAMRRVRPDPIPEEVQQRILDAAVRAPSGGDAQSWRFLFVDAPEVKARLGPVYRECMESLWQTIYAPQVEAARKDPEATSSKAFVKMRKSADWLANHFESYPLMMFAFTLGDPTGGSIFPAVWNAMLAARAEGVGSALTSVLLFQKERMFEILGVPEDQPWVFAGCVTLGYPTGRWGVAPRRPAHEVAYRNGWGEPVGFEIPEPLWSPG